MIRNKHFATRCAYNEYNTNQCYLSQPVSTQTQERLKIEVENSQSTKQTKTKVSSQIQEQSTEDQSASIASEQAATVTCNKNWHPNDTG